MYSELELYHKVVPLAQLGVWERNFISNTTYYNPVIRVIYEIDEHTELTDELLKSFYRDPVKLSNLISEAIDKKETQFGEFEILTAKDNHRWVKIRVAADYENGNCTRVYGSLEDITGQLQLISALEEREEKFHQAFDFAPIGMAMVSPTGEWVRVNNSICRLLGYEVEEFLKHTFQDFTHPDDLDLDLTLMNKLLNQEINNYSIEKRYYHKEGHLVWAMLSVSLVRDREGVPLYFISQIRDITERKKYLDALLKERLRLDNIIKSTQVGTWEWQVTTDETISNQRAAAILGYTFEELGLAPMLIWHSMIHPDDIENCIIQLQMCFDKKTKFFASECRMRHKDEHWLWVEIRGKVAEWTADNKPLLMLGTYTDIHQRKSQEQERKNALDVISEQNNRLMNFAHIVSHNLRSHTGNMQMLLDMLLQEDEKEEQNTLLRMLSINSANLQQTLTHLNDVVDVHSGNNQRKRSLNLHTEIYRTLEIVSASIKQTQTHIEVDVDSNLQVEFDPAYLDSILLNLLTNCVKYRHPERQLRINITAIKTPESIALKIADNGVGIDMALHGKKLFGMYKTFHGNKDARGIGLFLVKNQVEAMGGIITVESEAGKGSTFMLEISQNYDAAN